MLLAREGNRESTCKKISLRKIYKGSRQIKFERISNRNRKNRKKNKKARGR
jgi:hypothetical protein